MIQKGRFNHCNGPLPVGYIMRTRVSLTQCADGQKAMVCTVISLLSCLIWDKYFVAAQALYRRLKWATNIQPLRRHIYHHTASLGSDDHCLKKKTNKKTLVSQKHCDSSQPNVLCCYCCLCLQLMQHLCKKSCDQTDLLTVFVMWWEMGTQSDFHTGSMQYRVALQLRTSLNKVLYRHKVNFNKSNKKKIKLNK